MDLKDVVAKVEHSAQEAGFAYRAGYHDVAKNHLFDLEKVVVEYLRMPATPASDVTD